MSITKPTRRQLLVAGGLAGGGLFLGFALSGPSRSTRAGQALARQNEHMLTAWLKISPDNIVTVYVPHAEMGQGVHTSLPMMAAEEMEADWTKVRVEQAPATPLFANDGLAKGYLTHGMIIPSALTGITDATILKLAAFMNLQITGGSTSVRFTGHYGMRVAGAAAKDMLIRAAAKRWGVAPGECIAAMSEVRHTASGKSAAFGELAAEAAEFPPPANPVLKPRSDYRIVGKRLPRFDIPSKVDGSAVYGIDVRLPGMLHAAVRPAPVFGGEVARFDPAQAEGRRGVRKVVQIPGAVAVIADNFWRAKEAADALDIVFDAKGNEGRSSQTIFEQYDRNLDADDSSKDVETGDAEGALKGAARIVEAAYRVPYLAHACMEPMNCTVSITGDNAEVWVGTQDALGTAARIAKLLGTSIGNVTLHPLYLGGGFGRRSAQTDDFVIQAVQIAREAGAPVKLVWTRENDIQHDCYRPAVTSRFKAALDEKGMPAAWKNRYIGKNEPAEAAHIPYAVANQSIRYVDSPTHVPFGPWRSVAHSQHTYFTESFIDELAHEAGQDPFEYRRALLKDQPRHLAVLELAAAKAGWGTTLPKGHARGIAIQESFQSIVAEVAEISVNDAGKLRVHRVVAAVDCGDVINPDTVEAQVESGIIYGLTAALHGEITIENGAVRQSNFTDYEMLRMTDTPEIETHVIASGAALGGLGEPATPPVAAAVANAIFAATGRRIRELPFKNHDLAPLPPKLAHAAE